MNVGDEHVAGVSSCEQPTRVLCTPDTHYIALRNAQKGNLQHFRDDDVVLDHENFMHLLVRDADETIPYAMQSQEMNRHLWVRLELLPKPDNVRVNSSCVRYRLVAPNRVQQDVARQGTIFVMQKERQQVVLRRSELDFLARASYYPAIDVDLNIAECERAGRVGCCSPKYRLDASEQFASAEWLD